MAGGYSGKILRLNLTNRTVSIIDTEQYSENFGGAHGIGSAIYWDLAEDKSLTDGFDPRNIITVMGAPMSGAMVPGASGRTEVQGVGPQKFPVEWFTRSGFGGRFSAMLRYAGWDGIVIEGAADSPVWVNIMDDQVTFEDASGLWGMLTNEAQEEIWRELTGHAKRNEWRAVGDAYSTQMPAILCIGPAGENLSRTASLIHENHGAGQGGFGGVWGSKNLKAISVLGTGGVEIDNPTALMETRKWFQDNYVYNVDDPIREGSLVAGRGSLGFNPPSEGSLSRNPASPSRNTSCNGCTSGCMYRAARGTQNESQCVETLWYGGNLGPDINVKATDLGQHWGINIREMRRCTYLRDLYEMGVIGPGTAVETDLPWNMYGSLEWAEAFVRQIALRTTTFGDDLAEGIARAATKWGRYTMDTDSRLLPLPNWGDEEHYDPRVEVDWSYASILGERDMNEHSFNPYVYWQANRMLGQIDAGDPPEMTAEFMVETITSRMIPYEGDPFMLDYSEGPTGIYSANRVKTVAWNRHYSGFWQQGAQFCCWVWPNFITTHSADFTGATPEGEPRFFNAVTGRNITFADGMEIGRRVWNLDRAIRIMQGRHRDQEVLSGYVYNVPTPSRHPSPIYENGQWQYGSPAGRTLDSDRFEEWKTLFFEFEGWDASSGWPTRATLEEMDLGYVADGLQSAGRLGT